MSTPTPVDHVIPQSSVSADQTCSPAQASAESFDHIPTASELLDAYQQTQQDDPRSVFYRRVLTRPRIPVGRILLVLLLTALFCVLTYVSALRLTHSVMLSISVCAALLLALCILFAKTILITAVRIYQALAPAWLRSRCRYEPSCSAYMLLAVEKYGLRKGFQKGLARWRGCKPPNGGYDFP